MKRQTTTVHVSTVNSHLFSDIKTILFNMILARTDAADPTQVVCKAREATGDRTAANVIYTSLSACCEFAMVVREAF